MKHIRHDRTFIYYFDRRTDGTYVGIRVGRGYAWMIEGESNNPEMLTVRGNPEKVPMAGEGMRRGSVIPTRNFTLSICAQRE